MSVEQLESAVKGLEEVTLRAYLGKQQGSLTVRPVMDQRTNKLKGVKLLSEDEMKKSPYIVDAETERTIKDNTTISLRDTIDNIDWDWMKHCPEIKGCLEDCFSDNRALFYVENLEKDTNERIKKRSIKNKAFRYLDDASMAKRIEICSLLDIDAESWKPNDIEDYLGDIADTDPSRLVDAFEDDLIKVKLFLNGLIRKRIVKVDSEGIYRYASLVLGGEKKSVLAWLQLPQNAKTVKRMYDEVYPAPMAKDDADLEDSNGENFSSSPLEELTEEQLREKHKELLGKLPNGKAKIETIIQNIKDKEAEMFEEGNQL